MVSAEVIHATEANSRRQRRLERDSSSQDAKVEQDIADHLPSITLNRQNKVAVDVREPPVERQSR